LLLACAAAALLVLMVAAAPEADGPPSSLPAGFQDSVAFSGLTEPVGFRFSPDGRVFVAEKRGRIMVFDSMADSTPALFADLRKQTYDFLDHGLLGLALDPQFPTDPHVYAMYSFDHVLGEDAAGAFPRWGQEASNFEGDPSCTDRTKAPVDSCPSSGRLVRLVDENGHAKGGAATPLEEVMITDWCAQSSTHSIGDLEFGPEGALYASGGEGAMASTADYGQAGWTDAEIAAAPAGTRVSRANQCDDPPGARGTPLTLKNAEGGSLRSQDVITPASPGDPTGLTGTVIRIDPDTAAGLPDNPFHASSSTNERRIVAFGLRNPFRFAIRPATGEVYVNNVAGGPEEEIDRFVAIPPTAYNSGWPCYEGTHTSEVFEELELDLCEDLYDTPGSTSPPFFSYSHHHGVSSEDPCSIENGSAISGSAFYEGGPFPDAYDGALFFADAVRGCLYVMFGGPEGRPEPTTVMPFVQAADPYPGVDIQIGPEGALYYANLFGPGFTQGSIHKVAYFSDNQPPVARLTANPEWGPEPVPEGFKSKLDASGSSDPDGETLTFEWDLDGNGVYELIGTSLDTEQEVTYHDEAEHFVAVRVKDGKGASSVARVNLYPGDTPPQVSILKPVEGEPGEAALSWAVGDPIEFEGRAYDAEDAETPGEQMPSTSLDWGTRLYHCPGQGGCHAHPLQAFPSVGSGVLFAPDHEYPSRIELKLTATDSRGLSASKTIVVKAKPVTLSIESVPAGIPIGAALVNDETPFQVTAIEKSSTTLSAPLTAEVGGVEYDFVSWSDGGARVHAIEASPSQTQYTATYKVVEGPRHSLTVTPAGSGGGTVDAGSGAIAGCSKAGGECSGKYDEGSTVTLVADPAPDSALTWSGCDREPTAEECEVDIPTSDREVTATFALLHRALTIAKPGSGEGTVTCRVGAGAAGPCASAYDSGTALEVIATPAPHSSAGGDVFVGSTGSAQGCTSSPCSFTITADTSISATFTPVTHQLKVTAVGDGSGSVSCNGLACAPAYREGTTVTLAAGAAAGSRFAGWSGAGCSGAGICTVTLDSPRAVAAEFSLVPPDVCAANFSLCLPKPLKCKKHFRKKKVKGKPRCVKVRKHKGKRKHHQGGRR
jgi:glucose/arabinose dehydrogenase